MTKLEVNPGVCGLKSIITATATEDETVEIAIESQCAACEKMVDAINEDDELDPYDIVFVKPGDGPVYEAASEHCTHGACPVPCGIVKCVEAECKLALPRDVSMKFL